MNGSDDVIPTISDDEFMQRVQDDLVRYKNCTMAQNDHVRTAVKENRIHLIPRLLPLFDYTNLYDIHHADTPASVAIFQANMPMLSEICKLQPESLLVGSDGDLLPIHYAAERGNVDAIQILLEYAPNKMDYLASTTYWGLTPARMAAEFGHLECFYWIVEHSPRGIQTELEQCGKWYPIFPYKRRTRARIRKQIKAYYKKHKIPLRIRKTSK